MGFLTFIAYVKYCDVVSQVLVRGLKKQTSKRQEAASIDWMQGK